jgi:formylmethanofuran dehydrogenase subunit E
MSEIPDNYDMWAEHDAEQERELAKLPVCYECGEPIQAEECYEINDELICPECLDRNHKKYTEDVTV